ncbi:MAG TPA: NADP-specific glutamate dehydrogenase [Bacillota bacterium]|nr:NADP-specific glutamate dehydrogenase [Bacillota bacterium]
MSFIRTKLNENTCDYVNKVFEKVQERNPYEKEFQLAVKSLFDAITPLFKNNSIYEQHNILERIVEPDRIISFKVPWVDDKGKIHVNRGYRVQFNQAIGPYKGGIRFHPSVNLSIMKSLAFQQTIKNALTGQAIGGAKGGADFDPKGKSPMEIMRFCQSYMTELAKYIGPDIDVPAGDIGVGAREIGYMFGKYKRMTGKYEPGVITGKGIEYGGSLGRTEATGYGAIYFVEEMLREKGLILAGKSIVVSGSGNVAIHTMEKAVEKGAKIVACSDSSGYIYNENGLDVTTIKQLKLVEEKRIQEYLTIDPKATYCDQCNDIWSIPCDIALPCATQYEIDEQAAMQLVKNGVKVVAEGANMPSSIDAIKIFLDNDVLFGPAQAVNAGGVAVSSLEMAQNSAKISWSFEKIDTELRNIMKNIYHRCMTEAENYGFTNNLVIGASITGFKRIADAMIVQGVL